MGKKGVDTQMDNKKYKKYISKVAYKLKCTPEKRRELQGNLASDVRKALKKGETMNEIEKRMGSPKQLAKKLNESLSDEEVKAYKKYKRKNLLVVSIVFIITMGFMLWWWWPKTNSIEGSKVFEEATLQTQSEAIVDMIYEERYGDLTACSGGSLQATFQGMTAEDWQVEKGKMAEDWGAFKTIENIKMNEVVQMGTKYANVQLDACYENVTIHYTFIFDSAMRLTSLYMQ